MPFSSFEALTQQLGEFFQNRQYAEALDLITREGPHFPANRVWADYWKMCAAARVDQRALVYQVAAQFHADGLWYGTTLWRKTPSFQALQGDPEFERLVAEARVLEERTNPSKEPVSITRTPANHTATSPLLLALHGNQRRARDTLPFWEAALTQGWVVALPQSSQAIYTDAYIWDDLDIAFAEVQAHWARLQSSLAFEAERVILGGHSMGGLVAIQMALQGTVPVRGFVVNGPAVPFFDEPNVLEALLAPARERGVRGYFILGAQDDEINADGIQALVQKLQAAGIACAIDTIANATHDYASVYDEALLRGLAFVAG